ncbi:MAG TPA: 16S rRNA (cytosine(967)-C(5))-methyltransferase RsmB [Terriglobales bacterium]|nr:16S rRNA (cytosine(967)-C(5))-methyltransferase RsmB [Terriglobales bacterium]
MNAARQISKCVSPARAAAFDILLRIEEQDAYASELLHASPYKNLSSADHGLMTELVMGVLRWQSVLDNAISQASSQKIQKLDPEVLITLRMAEYQFRWLERIPARAAIHESVELVKRARKRSAAPFVNAVLRKLSLKAQPPFASEAGQPRELAPLYAHPEWLVERWNKEFGIEITRLICKQDQEVPPTTIRLRDQNAAKQLAGEGIRLSPGLLLRSAGRVESVDVTRTQVFRDGRVAIQDEASQLVATLVGHGSRMLDCCAAPGGKTSILADRNPKANIVAVELHSHRARLLRKLVRAGNVTVIAADARQLPFSGDFDGVLADVPCSGTGTLARNPEIKWRLKPEDLQDLQARQIAILNSAMSRVAPGGKLVYSTCSLEQEENSDVVEQALTSNSSFRLLECRQELQSLQEEGELVWKGLDSLIRGPYFRSIPGVHPCDGFFAAILQRKAATD